MSSWSCSSARTTRSTATKRRLRRRPACVCATSLQHAKPVLLEPIVEMEITVPDDKIGDITSDLNSRRGRVEGMDEAPGGFTDHRPRPAVGNDDVRPHPVQHDGRTGVVHPGVEPLRHGPAERTTEDRGGGDEGRRRRLSSFSFESLFRLVAPTRLRIRGAGRVGRMRDVHCLLVPRIRKRTWSRGDE